MRFLVTPCLFTNHILISEVAVFLLHHSVLSPLSFLGNVAKMICHSSVPLSCAKYGPGCHFYASIHEELLQHFSLGCFFIHFFCSHFATLDIEIWCLDTDQYISARNSPLSCPYCSSFHKASSPCLFWASNYSSTAEPPSLWRLIVAGGDLVSDVFLESW